LKKPSKNKNNGLTKAFKRLARIVVGDEVGVYRKFGGCPPVATIVNRVTKSIAICAQNSL
jgi:hypothetical protein